MPNQSEINEVRDWASQGPANGSQYPGMSYEEGVLAAIDWVQGDSDDRPDE